MYIFALKMYILFYISLYYNNMIHIHNIITFDNCFIAQCDRMKNIKEQISM